MHGCAHETENQSYEKCKKRNATLTYGLESVLRHFLELSVATVGSSLASRSDVDRFGLFDLRSAGFLSCRVQVVAHLRIGKSLVLLIHLLIRSRVVHIRQHIVDITRF